MASRRSYDKGTYKLQRYTWRSLLTFFGPLALLGFYCFICIDFLASEPVNDIVVSVRTDARWLYYLWFVVAVLTLEWARAGLANIEAAALMHRSFAPRTAMSLMWHTDTRWSNPLWWLRALRFWLIRMTLGRKSASSRTKGPNALWCFLSLTTVLLYIAMPVSGLTMELSTVFVSGNSPVQIFGPNSTSFNARGANSIQSIIYNYWQSGRSTTPLSDAILYAPHGTSGVSMTYFDDEVLQGASAVQFFAGPAVYETVIGRAWGVDANISCRAVPSAQLQLLRIHDVNNYSIHGCLRDDDDKSCHLSWNNTQELQKHGWPGPVAFPTWNNMTGRTTAGYFNFSAIWAADGWSQDTLDNANPYTYKANHDNLTFDHVSNRRPADDVTTSMFEIYIWQATQTEILIPKNLTEDTSGLVDKRRHHIDDLKTTWQDTDFYGIGVHCDVTTAVGYAEVDPAHRTYSNFQRTNAPLVSLNGLPNLTVTDPLDPNSVAPTYPAQILAHDTINSKMLNTQRFGYASSVDELVGDTWSTLHYSIGSPILPPTVEGVAAPILALTPSDLQLAMYRLLGASVIAMMDEAGVESWYGELYSLTQSRYLTPGVVPWIYVLVLLSVWALLTSIASLWLLFPAGPRWAPSLSGFEMFKFGARYTDQIDDLEEVEFQDCGESLSKIPGMVGVLPGHRPGGQLGTPSNNARLGFVGLSENVVESSATYTFDRKKAAPTRFSMA